MIDPGTRWFDIVELPVLQLNEHDIPTGTQGCKDLLTHKQKEEPYLDKTSAKVASLINMTSFCCYPCIQYFLKEWK